MHLGYTYVRLENLFTALTILFLSIRGSLMNFFVQEPRIIYIQSLFFKCVVSESLE